jgi:hypothetical protein
MRISDTAEIADRAAAYLHEPRSAACVDVIGIGSGVFDLLRRYKNTNVITGVPYAFNASAQSHRRDKLGQFRFLNDRAAAWWNLREMLDPAFGSNIALPDDDALIEELVAPRFGFNAGGTLKIESKDDIKRRIGRSTDAADAVIAAFWVSGDFTQEPFFEYGPQRGRSQQATVIPYEGFEDWEEGISFFDFSDI